MIKSKLNTLLREYVRNHLSPTPEEQGFVSTIYNAFKSTLKNRTLIIGSFARFTAIRPLHDLDILYIAGEFDPENLDPKLILEELRNTINSSFKNPTKYRYVVSQQTHSITVTFLKNQEEVFSVDIVPAFTSGEKNEYHDDIYWVPEILRFSKQNRIAKYEEFNNTKQSEVDWWIRSDPRGYIRASTDINAVNDDFRKTAKFIKRWKHNCKEKFGDFKLKSFHIEQGVFQIFRQKSDITIIDSVFLFFCNIPEFIDKPQIADRANPSKFIDEYLNNLTKGEKEKIIEVRDAFLIKLEELSQDSTVDDLLEADIRRRASASEEYLFDSHIPTYTDPNLTLAIKGKVLERTGSFRSYFLDFFGKIIVDREIEFRISADNTDADIYKWKVKNDDNSSQPRGEITDHKTLNDPEHTKFKGNHYVECYAVKNGVCIARAHQNVVL